ncbi:membrane protein [Philodulcilactobacillus myokoensis]|uniref:Membrane protein n=1 Tax=Philodulcilactobacillus myokoensis TaxID=2929573 RepID=A0A9W6B1Q8_9LACO|nr:YitT family protein [Philodulcilactobacillus myokoensis]GLB46920.1 membrane protein [Philodulcilactobacillus myokoensis]
MDDLFKKHQYLTKASFSLIYAIMVSLAMNIFWTPGHIYSSGYTGFAQLLNTITSRYFPVTISTSLALFIINIPMFILAWRHIGHQFTFFTFLSVLLASIMMRVIHPLPLTTDPMICAIFGGVINGFGTGWALKNQISTGGLDILGIVIRRKTGKTIGTVNIIFNSFIIVAAGFAYGWPYAFYSAIGLFVNGKMIDMAYTRQQRMQVMIVTSRPKMVIDSIQNHLRRGITIVHGAEGAYYHDKKTILFTAISLYEMNELEEALSESDSKAFATVTSSTKIIGHFYEPKR